MTCIAYRDGILASDSRLTAGTLIMPSGLDKVRRLKNGSLVGACGDAAGAEAILDWAARMKGKPSKACEGAQMILVKPDGTLVEYEDGRSFRYKDKHGFIAIGSGAHVALGAMWMGATAEEAVQAAIDLNSNCGGPIKLLKLKE